MNRDSTPTRFDHSRGFRFPTISGGEAHEPTAAVRMSRCGWPAKAIADALHMDIGKVRVELAQAPGAEREAFS